MSPTDPLSRRHALALLAWGLALAALPASARADGGNSGPGGGDDDDDDDDDDEDDGGRGRGRGRGRGGDEDEDEDRDPDEPGGDGRDYDRSILRDITVLYPDGWIERIVSGRYELMDHLSRLVVARPATPEDFARMIALR